MLLRDDEVIKVLKEIDRERLKLFSRMDFQDSQSKTTGFSSCHINFDKLLISDIAEKITIIGSEKLNHDVKILKASQYCCL